MKVVVGGGRTVFVSELLCGGVRLEPGGQNKTNTRPLSAERMCTQHEGSNVEDHCTRNCVSVQGNVVAPALITSCAAMFNLAFIVKFN